MKFLLVLAGLLAVASAQIAFSTPFSFIIPNGFYEFTIAQTEKDPSSTVEFFYSSTPGIVVGPTGLIFLAGKQSAAYIYFTAASSTNGPEQVNITTTSNDTDFHSFVTYTFHVIQPCGVVNISCPAGGDWVYLNAEMTKPSLSLTALLNVTVQGASPYDIFINTNQNCPSETSNSLRFPATDTTNTTDRAALAEVSPGTVTGTEKIYITIGLRRRADQPCVSSLVTIFDANQNDTFPSLLACTADLAVLPSCKFVLLPWMIAVIVIAVVIFVAIVVGIAIYVFKRR